MLLLTLLRTRARLTLALVLCAPLVACGGGGGTSGGGGGGGIGPLRGTVNTVDVQFTIDRINQYRATIGVGPLSGDQQLHDFAVDGSQQLLNDHSPHQHIRDRNSTLFTTDGFRGSVGENQGDPRGWPPAPTVREQINQILSSMWAEGPGGGHYDNMANAAFLRLGVGLVLDDFGRLYFTNDFSG